MNAGLKPGCDETMSLARHFSVAAPVPGIARVGEWLELIPLGPVLAVAHDPSDDSLSSQIDPLQPGDAGTDPNQQDSWWGICTGE